MKHCERKTDICYRRLDFLNQNLKEQFGIDLFDAKKVNPDQLLTDFLQEYHAIQDLSNDEAFMAEWLEHEYFQLGGKTAKWQSYHSSDL